MPYDGRIQVFYNEPLFNQNKIRLFNDVPNAGNNITADSNTRNVGWPLNHVLCPWRWDPNKQRPVAVSTPDHTICELQNGGGSDHYWIKYQCTGFSTLRSQRFQDQYCTDPFTSGVHVDPIVFTGENATWCDSCGPVLSASTTSAK